VTKRPKTGPSRPMGFEALAGWLRDRRIGIKLGFIMFVPTLATVIVGANGLVSQISNANTADRARTLATLSADAGTLVDSLQDERADAALYLSYVQDHFSPHTTKVHFTNDQIRAAETVYHNQQLKSTQALTDYTQQAAATSDIPANLRSLLTTNTSNLNALSGLRNQVVTASAQAGNTRSAATDQYANVIRNLLAIRDSAAQLAGDPTLSFEMRAAGAIAQTKEFIAQERVTGIELLTDGIATSALRKSFFGGITGQAQGTNAFSVVATQSQQNLLKLTVNGDGLRPSADYENRFIDTGGTAVPTGFSPDQWNAAMATRANLYRQVEVALDKEIVTDASAARDSVERQIIIDVGLLFAIVLIAMVIAWLVARSMNRALRELKHGALTVARQGLPQAVARLRDPTLATQLSPQQIALQIAEPLPVRSKDEFGEVTEAFNAVHIEAVRTAAEQAVLRSSVATMFVNLARRSQILVDRLIGHLDRLERGEEDPDRLAELFQLDHLATRMRRNDENLLVLAGADSTRVQREPAPLVDVLRAAQSEVEHYTRVEFGSIDRDLEIASHAVNDLVHLVAELLDNATAFSPPDSPVLVEARRFGDRAVLYVEDRGIGISADQLADLNDRLAKPPLVDVAVSRMMGLVVVARLAARHGIEVKLRPSADRGTVADVLLPPSVLINTSTAFRGAPPVAGAERVALNPSEPPRPAARSPFGAPLALESGPSATERTPAGAGTSSGYAGSSANGYNGSAEFGGFAAAAERFGTNRPTLLGPGVSSRALPSWSDLTGAVSAGAGAADNDGYNGARNHNGDRGYGGHNGASGNGHPGSSGHPGVPTSPLPRRASPADDPHGFDDLRGYDDQRDVEDPRGLDGPRNFDAPPFERRPFDAPPPFEPRSFDDARPFGGSRPFDEPRPFEDRRPTDDGRAFERRPLDGPPNDAQAPRVPRQRPHSFDAADARTVDDLPEAEVIDEHRAPGPAVDADDAVVTRFDERQPPTSAPPAWPPVSAQPATAEAEDGRQFGNSARVDALDMTAEIPRFRDLDLASAVRADRGSSPDDFASDDAPAGRAASPAAAERTAGAVRPEPSRSGQGQPQVMPFTDETMELPIFRALESAWFAASGSSGRSLIAPRQSDVATVDPSPRAPTAREVPQPRAATGGRPTEYRESDVRSTASRSNAPVSAGARSDYYQDTAGGNQMAGSATGSGRGGAENSWHSSADDGWSAAAAAAEPVDGGTTAGGLPRRVPLAQLVPGSVERAATGSNRRSPDAVRGLLSAYHRGVQRGRQQMSDDSNGSPESTTSGRPAPGGKEQDR
jgi:signal transduction histidine kinase